MQKKEENKTQLILWELKEKKIQILVQFSHECNLRLNPYTHYTYNTPGYTKKKKTKTGM